MPSIQGQKTAPAKTAAGRRAKSVEERTSTSKQRPAETETSRKATVSDPETVSASHQKHETYFTGKNLWAFTKILGLYVTLSSLAALIVLYFDNMSQSMSSDEVEFDLSERTVSSYTTTTTYHPYSTTTTTTNATNASSVNATNASSTNATHAIVNATQGQVLNANATTEQVHATFPGNNTSMNFIFTDGSRSNNVTGASANSTKFDTHTVNATDSVTANATYATNASNTPRANISEHNATSVSNTFRANTGEHINGTNVTVSGNGTDLNATQVQWREDRLMELQLDFATLRNKILDPLHKALLAFGSNKSSTLGRQETRDALQLYLQEVFQKEILEGKDSSNNQDAFGESLADAENKPLLFRLRKTLRRAVATAKSVKIIGAVEDSDGAGIKLKLGKECEKNTFVGGQEFLEAPPLPSSFLMKYAKKNFAVEFDQPNGCVPSAKVTVIFTPQGTQGHHTPLRITVGEL